jgi:hypothetical protein
MKLTLRELFLLVALAAMGCGWWVDRLNQERKSARWRERAVWASEILRLNDLRFRETIQNGKIQVRIDSMDDWGSTGPYNVPTNERMSKVLEGDYPLP